MIKSLTVRSKGFLIIIVIIILNVQNNETLVLSWVKRYNTRHIFRINLHKIFTQILLPHVGMFNKNNNDNKFSTKSDRTFMRREIHYRKPHSQIQFHSSLW